MLILIKDYLHLGPSTSQLVQINTHQLWCDISGGGDSSEKDRGKKEKEGELYGWTLRIIFFFIVVKENFNLK